jgi:hypothetical protein
VVDYVNSAKASDGQAWDEEHKAFSLTLDNGKAVIGKISNLNAGPSHFITASEVATMDFCN